MNKRRGGADHTLLIFAFALFMFNSPANDWWSALALPWFAMFVPWLLVVVLLAWNLFRQNHGD